MMLLILTSISNSFLEYVPGGTIATLLNRHGRFCEEVTKSFTKQILDGLEYLHSRKILHRVSRNRHRLCSTKSNRSFSGPQT